jgi:hypothetical protein
MNASIICVMSVCLFDKVIETVENNIKELQQQIGILEYHVEKTEIWCENIGNWKTSIISVDMSISNHVDADPVPHFVIQVKLFDNKQAENNTDGKWSTNITCL